MYESMATEMATRGEMKALLVLSLVLLTAATVFAYRGPEVVSGVTAALSRTAETELREPVTMLLSGSVLLGLATAVRRLTL